MAVTYPLCAAISSTLGWGASFHITSLMGVIWWVHLRSWLSQVDHQLQISRTKPNRRNSQVLLLALFRVRFTAATSADLRQRKEIHHGQYRWISWRRRHADTLEKYIPIRTGMGHYRRSLERCLGLLNSLGTSTELFQLCPWMGHQCCEFIFRYFSYSRMIRFRYHFVSYRPKLSSRCFV